MGVLISKPGITSASTLSIPKDWSPSWFRNLIDNQLKGADVRNAVGSGGIQVSGNIASPYATIGFSPPIILPGPVTVNGNLTITGNVISSVPCYNLPDTGGSAQWIHLGTWTNAVQAGFKLRIRITIGSGYNAQTFQNAMLDVFFKTSNNSSFQPGSSGNFYADGMVQAIGQGVPSSAQVLAVQNNVNSYDIFLLWGGFSGASFYEVIPTSGTVWTNSGTLAGASTPSGNSLSLPFNATFLSWIAPSLGAGISNYGSPFDNAAYSRDPNGKISLKGLIKGAGLTIGAVIFTLPSAYTPPAAQLISTPGFNGTSNGIWQLNILQNGQVLLTDVQVGSGTPTGWLSLCNITFANT